MPACEPVNDTAGSPRSIDRHAEQRHRDPLARGEQHVHLAAGRGRSTPRGRAAQVVGGLAHRRDHDHDVVAAAAGAHDVIGDGPDAVGIGDRGAAELLDEQAHGTPMVPRCRPRSFVRILPSVDCPAVPKATKRERQRQNKEVRRAAMQEAEKRRKRNRTIRNLVLLLIPLAIIFVILQLTNSDDSSDTKSSSVVGADKLRQPRRGSPTTTQTLPASPPMHDRHDEAVHGGDAHELRRRRRSRSTHKHAPKTVNSFVFLAERVLRRHPFHRIVNDFVDPGRRPERRRHRRPRLHAPRRAARRTATRRARWRWPTPGPARPGSQFFLVVSDTGAQNLDLPAVQVLVARDMDAAGLDGGEEDQHVRQRRRARRRRRSRSRR